MPQWIGVGQKTMECFEQGLFEQGRIIRLG